MRTTFVPKEFSPPNRALLGDNYYLVPILATNALEDWLVLTGNAEAIVEQRGGGSHDEWPFVCTLEENFKDLAWLEQCAVYHQLFCYILRKNADDSYAGCVYIYPIELFFNDKAEEYDVDFSFWITAEEFQQGMYNTVFIDLVKWLTDDWPFEKERLYLRNKLIPENMK